MLWPNVFTQIIIIVMLFYSAFSYTYSWSCLWNITSGCHSVCCLEKFTVPDTHEVSPFSKNTYHVFVQLEDDSVIAEGATAGSYLD
jgi:hypothetical protein